MDLEGSYRVHKRPPLVPNVSQAIQTDYLKINVNIVIPSTPRYSKQSPSFRFTTKALYAYLFPMRVTSHAQLILLHLISLIFGGNKTILSGTAVYGRTRNNSVLESFLM